MTAVLLVVWLLIGNTRAVSIYSNHYLNYMELFFLLNLGIFTGLSQYVIHSQSLTVVMVGSALVVFCGILGLRTFLAVSKYKAIQKVSRLIQLDIFKRKDASGEPQSYTQGLNSTNTTRSVVEMAGCVAPSDKLRESLLTSNIHES